MKTFSYIAFDDEGLEHTGSRTVSSREQLTNDLLEEGLLLHRVRRSRVKNSYHSRAPEALMGQLELLLKANISVVDALDLASNTASREGRLLALTLLERIRSGSRFSEAVASLPSVFDAQSIALIDVGERTGELRLAVDNIRQHLQWQRELRQRLRQLLVYPVIVGCVLSLVLAFLLMQVVPALSELLEALNQSLPPQTRLLLWLSDRSENILLGVGLAVALLVSSIVVLSRFRASHLWLRKLVLRLPYLGNVTLQIRLARFARTMAELTGARIDLLKAIEISKPVLECVYLEHTMQAVHRQVLNGKSFSSAVSGFEFLPDNFARLLHLGEASGQLPEMFLQLSNIYDSTSRAHLAFMEAAITPIMMTLLGGLLMWIVLAVLGPLYSVLSVTGTF